MKIKTFKFFKKIRKNYPGVCVLVLIKTHTDTQAINWGWQERGWGC